FDDNVVVGVLVSSAVPAIVARLVTMLVARRAHTPERANENVLIARPELFCLYANEIRITAPPAFCRGDLDIVAARPSDRNRSVQVANANPTTWLHSARPIEIVALAALPNGGQSECDEKQCAAQEKHSV